MKAIFRRSKKKRSSLVLAMLDIISNAMAGIAVLFFLHVALQLQEPPPVPVRGRLVLEAQLQSPMRGASQPVVFLRYENKKSSKYDFLYFDGQIDGEKVEYKFTEDPNAQISFDRLVLRQPNDRMSWEIHIMDPFEGDYTLGMIYVDHEQFEKQPVPHRIAMKSYFELSDNGKEYRSKRLLKAVKSPTSYHEFKVTIDQS